LALRNGYKCSVKKDILFEARHTEEKNNIDQFYLNALTDNNAFLRKQTIDRLNLTDNALLNPTKKNLSLRFALCQYFIHKFVNVVSG
jgi:hypothetical protein